MKTIRTSAYYFICLFTLFLLQKTIQLSVIFAYRIPFKCHWLEFSFPSYTSKWSIITVFCIYGLWPILFLITYLIMGWYTLQQRIKGKRIKEYQSILIICLYVYPLSMVIGGLTFHFGVGYFSEWLYIDDTFRLIITLCTFALLIAGIINIKKILGSPNHPNNDSIKYNLKQLMHGSLIITILLSSYFYYTSSLHYIFPLCINQIFIYLYQKEMGPS